MGIGDWGLGIGDKVDKEDKGVFISLALTNHSALSTQHSALLKF
ncbi:hypothetical protein [Nostoc sp. CMAA1605]|nr:hypothetical protein [Nostoc sp. CMAA1605]